MKIKDIERTANIAWSPATQNPILLAAGTAAQQLDASFNTNAALEIYSLNLLEPGFDMELTATVASDQRFQKIIWGSHGSDPTSGTIVGGCDGGIVQIYNVSKLLQGEKGLVGQQNKHKGSVHALDFNPFKQNLLATGAGESEIYIWDLNNTSVPMTPGAKSQPFEDVMCISWNRQVQHILASTFPSKCVVWDLRKNEPIIKLTDTASRIRWKAVAWHPEVATQLCLASEEDQAPIIQLWDLRFATSPLKTLENHQRGVLSIAWCLQDSDLLVSCGKDNRIVCWNPNSNSPGGEVLSEIAKTNQWNFDVSWCPKNPALIACPSFDGHVSIYSVMGGKTQQFQTTDKIADSFPGMEGYVQAPVPQQSAAPVSVDLIKAPRWMKRPVRTSFAFGGKLVTFTNDIAPPQGDHLPATPIRSVFISQVITEPELMNQSAQLEEALEYGNFTEYCRNKADALTDQHKRNIWYFIKANFEENPRAELLNLLGYKIEEVRNKLNEILGSELENEDNLNEQFSNLIKPGSYDNSLVLNQLSNSSQHVGLKNYTIKTTNDTEGYITQALLLGNTEAAVELCLKAEKYADAIIIAMTGGSELLARTQFKYLRRNETSISALIAALVAEDWSSVINNCDINSWKEALVAVLTHASDEDMPKLCELLGNRLEEEGHSNPKLTLDAQLCYICAGSFDKLVNSWSRSVKRSSNELQELVELVTFLQKAIERQGRSVEISGSLAKLLSYYASILAAQGNLSAALSYLGNSENEQVAHLRDRLRISLGQKPLYEHVQPRSRYSSRHSFSSNSGQINQPMINPLYNQFNTGLPTPPISQPWQQQAPNFNQAVPPKTFSPPPAHPNRPPSAGSAPGGGITSRAKYVVDPSVQSGGPYGTRNQYGSPMMPAPQQQQMSTYSAASFVPNNAPANPVPLIPTASQPSQSPFYNPNLPSIPVERGEEALPLTPRMQHIIPPPLAAPGWNDPPALTRSTARVQPKQDYSQPEPITHPLYGSTPAQNVPPSNGFVEQPTFGSPNPYNHNMPPPPNNSQILQPNFNQQQNFNNQPINPGSFNQNAFNTNFQNAPQQQRQSNTPTPREKPPPVQKEPIPDEYKPIQSVFEELRDQCAFAAKNPQTKRKLEDVARKLEFLYDMLREHRLSANTINSLQQLLELIQAGDYVNCLSLHTQLVSGPDFAQIASFMPGLKVLIQCALQLQVYLR